MVFVEQELESGADMFEREFFIMQFDEELHLVEECLGLFINLLLF